MASYRYMNCITVTLLQAVDQEQGRFNLVLYLYIQKLLTPHTVIQNQEDDGLGGWPERTERYRITFNQVLDRWQFIHQV